MRQVLLIALCCAIAGASSGCGGCAKEAGLRDAPASRAPPRAKPAEAEKARLDAREALQSNLEGSLDALCGAWKAGHRALPAQHAAVPQPIDVSRLVLVHTCSLRALRFDPSADERRTEALLTFELEGLTADGARAILRGEAQAQFERREDGWKLLSTRGERAQIVERARSAFIERTPAAGEWLAPREFGPEDERGVSSLNSLAGGLGAADLDGDGLWELLAVDRGAVQVLRNRGGMSLVRETLPNLLPDSASALAIADFDNDGDPDLVVLAHRSGPAESRRTPSWVFANVDGALQRVGQLPASGPLMGGVPTDFDGDGSLDLVVIPYGTGGSDADDYFEATNGAPPVFLRNIGQLRFAEVPLPESLRPGRWGLAAASADLLGTGRPQVYVANDFGSNDLWSHQPDGGFTEHAEALGLRDPGNGMSVDFGDVNADGKLDVYVANMFSKAGTRVVAAANLDASQRALAEKFAQGNTLYVSGDGGFAERAVELGVNRGLWAFGSVFLDYDDDGRLDVAVANGFLSNPNRKDL